MTLKNAAQDANNSESVKAAFGEGLGVGLKSDLDPELIATVVVAVTNALEQILTAIELNARCALAQRFVLNVGENFEFDQVAFEKCFESVCNPSDDVIPTSEDASL